MPARIFYLAAYDVTDPDRLQAALRVLRLGADAARPMRQADWFVT